MGDNASLSQFTAAERHGAAVANGVLNRNTTGVPVSSTLPEAAAKQAVANAVGHAETAFLAPSPRHRRVHLGGREPQFS